jgi:hypothetical protein
MRTAKSTLSLVPSYDNTVYLVLDSFGAAGNVYRETNEGEDLPAIVSDLIGGQYNSPLRVVAFNTAEGWSRDISIDVSREILQRLSKEKKVLTPSTRDFVSSHLSEHETRRAEISIISSGGM